MGKRKQIKDSADRLRKLQRMADAAAQAAIPCYKTINEIGKAHQVADRTAARWVQMEGFPGKTKTGYPSERVEDFLKEKQLGKYRQKWADQKNRDGPTLTEANTLKALEQTALARIQKERQLVEQQIELGRLIDRDQAHAFYKQTAAVITQIVDAFVSTKDRELPEDLPAEEAWPAVRARIMELDRRLHKDIADAVHELVAGN